MQSLDEHVTIPADTSSGNDLDFDFLREMGQQYIEKLGRRIWTDYNIHDPGITILELLCYAITDLGLRLDMDIRDILASKEDNFRQMHEQFASAARILTCKPVTSSDYRKLFIDLDGVKNAWLRPFRLPLQLDCDPERPVLRYEPLIGNTKKTMQIDIRGLYSILVDFDEHADEPAVIRNIETLYHQNRNLCEDLAEVRRVPLHCIRVCGAIQLEPGVDEELVHAQILWAIRNYFSPDILPLSLSEMQAKGFAPDEIFNGPVLQHGFISDEDLQNSELRTEVRLSDIIRLIMSVDGVKVIEDISIDNGPAADASKSDGCCGDLSILQTSPWMICIQPGHKPYLSDRSNFTYKKVYLPVGINKSKVDAYILGFERELQNRLDRVYEDLAIPLGEYRDIGAYSTIQHDLPETYGISPSGLPSSVSEERKARAKQLKGYLLFYDQVMAQYFSHLEHVKQLLAADEKLKRIYFFKAVDDIRGIEELAGDPSLYEQNVSRILHDPANPADFTGPRERLLDHLLSRFAEVFSDYSSVMYKLFGPLVEADILLTKNRFLEKYDTLSSERGLAFNYTLDHSWNTGNVTGFEKRLAFLAGIRDYNRRNLYSHKLFIETIPKLEDGINFNEYRWVIKDDTTTYLSSRNDFRLEQEAIDDLLHSLKISSDEENFHLHQTSGGLYYVVLAEPAYRDNPDYRHVIGRQY
ncbi:MAG: hypothetical protein WCK34_12590, partial [Bacteroidota bacterium]